ncbi:MAG: hypothetical protein HY291_05095 [Planctomycetes bacterium]|nr:hypothetical protein [Planctomycetota bacterium]
MKLRTRGLLAGALLLLCAGGLRAEEPKPNEEKKVKVNFIGLDLATLAKQVEKIANRSFLYDENILRNKHVTLQSETPIGPDEFYRVFQAVCQTNQLVIVPVEGSGINLEKIVNAQGAFKEPGAQKVLVQGENVPKDDSLVSYLVKLKNTTPSKVLAVLQPALSPIGSVTQIPNSDLLMINDMASSVKRAEKLLALLDVPGDPVASTGVTILNMSADKAQGMLNEYLQAFSKATTGEAGRERVVILRDERLNSLHLIGPEKDVARAAEFLKTIDLDVPTARRSIRYYKLKNVAVKDIVDYVGQLLGVALAARGNEAAPTPAVSAGAPGAQAQPAQPAPQPPPMLRAPEVTRGQAQGAQRRPGAIPAELIPVEGLNTLVVSGDATVHKEVEAILENLDQRKGQVLIEVAIVQVTGDDSQDLGLEFLTSNNAIDNKKSDGGTGFGLGTQSDPTGRGFPTVSSIAGFTGGAYRFIKENEFQIVMKALATKSNVSIVSQPLLLVNDNEQASFTTKVSEPTITTSQGTATTNTSFAGFADATTALKITPHISPDGYVNLEIGQTFEEFTGSSSGNGIPPPKVSNDTNTKVTVPDRNTIVIGGFTRDSSSDTKTGVPGLMHIPGLGKLFTRDNKRKTASRLYLFARPKILTTVGFEDLKSESGVKKDDVESLSRKSDIKKEIKERIGRPEAKAEIVMPMETPKEEGAPKR